MIIKHCKQLAKKEGGYVALLTVIILGVVATTVAMSLVLLGLSHSRSALSENQTFQAKAGADACAEDVLRQIRLSSTYVGVGNLALAGSTCSYAVTNTGGSTRSIAVTGTAGPNIRKLEIVLSAVTPNILFTSWQEVP